MSDKTPFEVRCPNAKNVGWEGHEIWNCFYTCDKCHGRDKVPTEAGQQILDLVERHFRRMLRNAMDDLL